MNRATIVYVSMLAVCVAGLWAILSLGNALTPPEDFAGKWRLTPLEASTTMPSTAPSDLGAWGSELTIEQSGRYFQLAFERGPRLNLILQPVPASNGPPITVSQLDGGDWHASLEDVAGKDRSSVLRIDGPNRRGAWIARRIERRFPPTQTEGAH